MILAAVSQDWGGWVRGAGGLCRQLAGAGSLSGMPRRTGLLSNLLCLFPLPSFFVYFIFPIFPIIVNSIDFKFHVAIFLLLVCRNTIVFYF